MSSRDGLMEAACSFGFTQWIRLWLREGPSGRDGDLLERLSEGLDIHDPGDPSFPAGDLGECREENSRHRLAVHFMGLHGPASPLSEHFLDGLLRRRESHAPLGDFLEIFEGRAFSLLAWASLRRRPVVRLEWSRHDPYGQRIDGLLGNRGEPPRALEERIRRRTGLWRVGLEAEAETPFHLPLPILGRCRLDGSTTPGGRARRRAGRLSLRLTCADVPGFLEACQDLSTLRKIVTGTMEDHLAAPQPWSARLECPSLLPPGKGNILCRDGSPRLGRTAWIGSGGGKGVSASLGCLP